LNPQRFDKGYELVLGQEELAAMGIAEAAQAQLPAEFARRHLDRQPGEKMIRLMILRQHGVLL
jgi:alpha-D-ribose 1-methylphosphonate 5-triphosphate synthase subunit PhnI